MMYEKIHATCSMSWYSLLEMIIMAILGDNTAAGAIVFNSVVSLMTYINDSQLAFLTIDSKNLLESKVAAYNAYKHAQRVFTMNLDDLLSVYYNWGTINKGQLEAVESISCKLFNELSDASLDRYMLAYDSWLEKKAQQEKEVAESREKLQEKMKEEVDAFLGIDDYPDSDCDSDMELD